MPNAVIPRLHVVTGKGGTGKTTVASALALALAAGGKRVLICEVEGRQGLAQLFDRPPLPYEETRLAASRGGDVFGLAIDPEAAMLEYLDMFYSMKRPGAALRKLGAIDFATTIAPGLRDVLLTGKVKEIVTRDKKNETIYDAVVIDAPPTGRIVQFLDATREVAGLTKVGPIYRQSVGVSDLLHAPQTVVHVVTLLEEMPVQETIDAVAELRAAGYNPGHVIVNRAKPELVSSAALNAESVSVLAEGLKRIGIDESFAAPLDAQLREYGERQQLQAESASRLDGIDLPITRLPDLSPPMDLGAMFELADDLADVVNTGRSV